METNGKYDYEESMISDIIDWLHEHHLEEVILNDDFADEDFDCIYYDLWTEDSVTGNANGSYWFSTWKAEEALCHNLELYVEACEYFGMEREYDISALNAESMDVNIRCYLLHGCLEKAIERIQFQARAERELEIPF